MNLKHIHIGKMIEKEVADCGIEISRICNFIKCNEEDINQMYLQENLPTDVLLKWNKLLEYDFFRIYSQHLILLAPQSAKEVTLEHTKSSLPQFEKTSIQKKL